MCLQVLKEIPYLEIASNVATVYGFLWALPNFIHQMRLTNASANAGEALKQLGDVKNIAEHLFKARKSDKERIKIIPALYEAFQKLNNTVELILLNDKGIKVSDEWIKKSIAILKKNIDAPSDGMANFFMQEIGDDWYVKNEYTSKELYNLKNELQKIHRNPYSNGFLRSNWPFFIFYVACVVMRVLKAMLS